MLGILKVNAGIGTDGSAEFSLTIVDVNDHIYEVDIDDKAYAQVVGVIEESAGVTTDIAPEPVVPVLDPQLTNAPGPGNGLNNLSPEKKAAIAKLLAGGPGVPQHTIEGDQPQELAVPSMSDVGFDVDYSADLYDDEEEEDPGEELVGPEDEYVNSL